MCSSDLAEERRVIDGVRKRQAKDARFDDGKQCALGREVPANSVLKLTRVKDGSADFLNLAIIHLETGCQTQVASTSWEANPNALAREAVANLLGKLRQDRVAMPGTVAALPTPPPRTGPIVQGSAPDQDGPTSGPVIKSGRKTAATDRKSTRLNSSH